MYNEIEEIEKCIEKIEAEVEKNNEDMKSIRVALINALGEFNEKKFELSKCKRYKKMAENDYNEIYEKAFEPSIGLGACLLARRLRKGRWRKG